MHSRRSRYGDLSQRHELLNTTIDGKGEPRAEHTLPNIGTMRRSKVLIVDDEPKIRRIVGSYLREEGFDVAEAGDGETALRLASSNPDLVVLDVMLPGIDGIEVLRRLRTRSDVPVILLTARAEETDKLVGLSVGADDYLTKPFSPRELVARVKAVLRRIRVGADTDRDGKLRFSGLAIDPDNRTVVCGGREPELTALEFDLLATLARAPGRVFTRQQLIEEVWGWDFFGDERVVDVHVRNLRSKLGDAAADPEFVGTVRGVGYKLVAEPL